MTFKLKFKTAVNDNIYVFTFRCQNVNLSLVAFDYVQSVYQRLSAFERQSRVNILNLFYSIPLYFK